VRQGREGKGREGKGREMLSERQMRVNYTPTTATPPKTVILEIVRFRESSGFSAESTLPNKR